MSGLDASTSGGSSDLLKRATQALMMSKTTPAATDDDGADQISFDSPRSGVATPRPDLHDKRLPGIMSYFGQVGIISSQSCIAEPGLAELSEMASSLVLEEPESRGRTQCQTPNIPLHTPQGASGNRPHSLDLPSCRNGSRDISGPTPQGGESDINLPYPTPPPSQRPSSELCTGAAGGGVGGGLSIPRSLPLREREADKPNPGNPRSFAKTPLDSIVATSAETAVHLPTPQTTQLSETVSAIPTPPSDPPEVPVKRWLSFPGLQLLTRAFKSGPSTPTRALSTAQPSPSEDKNGASRAIAEMTDSSRSATPRPPGGAQAPAAKGKLTVKITEAKGLRKSRDPYVVVVFQRSELISSGPRPEVDADDANKSLPLGAMGGIPIQRQGSDSGRPPMAIPMRSRQSSSTSVADYNAFRSRGARQSFTNPKWDAEAVFDVVESDLLVNISVYDHGLAGEIFLGHIDFTASLDNDAPVHGWFPLRGHADTIAENQPTGEIYVEATYQRSERKHFGPEDFQILKLIGKGTFGQVYQVRKRDTQRIYAMKVLSKKVIVQKKEVAHTVGERNILVRTAMSDSPFIVGLKFSFQTPSDLYLVTDYMSGGELFWHLQKEGRFDERRAKFYIAELILAIQHLHNNDIVYRDLKPENILLDANGHIALCDFGLSKANLTKNDTTNTFCGTTEYLAPEVLLDESGYTKMVDFWSLGVLVFEMCCGWSPFYAEDTQQMYKNIAFGKVRFPRDTLSQEGRNFVKGLLNRNPKHRLGATDDAEELKRHPFFGDIDWDLLTKKLITPPFKPKLKSETDVSYFDPEFTNALDTNGSLNERAAALARGFAASTPLSPSVQANFRGFTFVDESALEDNMGDRGRYDDEDMNDAHHEDDEWDNLDDIDLRRTNRMSGIVRTSTNDEQMVGGHFEV